MKEFILVLGVTLILVVGLFLCEVGKYQYTLVEASSEEMAIRKCM